ncbi:MAG: hypothetical protein IPO18_06280 [bacterium]|nr:hypothetical protein [bacterium]
MFALADPHDPGRVKEAFFGSGYSLLWDDLLLLVPSLMRDSGPLTSLIPCRHPSAWEAEF